MADMRDVYGEGLIELAEKDERIVVLEADLMRANGTAQFKKRFPARSFNMGVAEANMVGVAAGLSASGKIPFANTFASFAGRRDYDQFFLMANYARLNVKLVGTDPGILAAINGGTHMPFEDLGVMRNIPHCIVVEPSDAVCLKRLLPQIAYHKGSVYMRLNRKAGTVIHAEGEEFILGKANVVRDGKDVAIFACGSIPLAECVESSKLLAAEGISAAVVDFHTIKPIDRKTILHFAEQTGLIVTCENHQIVNGLGSAVAEVLGENRPTRMLRIGVDERFGEVGSVDYLKKAFGFDAETITARTRSFVRGE
ncbi:MAG: transketolase C-terminal domain-containing protein [Rectinemataceae bacterium]|jgi:transketolase